MCEGTQVYIYIQSNNYVSLSTLRSMLMQMLTWTNSLIPGLLNDYCESDPVDGEAPLEITTLQPSTTDMLGEAPLFTQSPPSSGRRRRRNFNTLPSTHCSVFSSEPVNGTLLSMLVINGELLEQSLYFTCHGNESGSSSVQLLVTSESVVVCACDYPPPLQMSHTSLQGHDLFVPLYLRTWC